MNFVKADLIDGIEMENKHPLSHHKHIITKYLKCLKMLLKVMMKMKNNT